ncbi:MAG: Tex family protein [Candidatus Enteromonas sp.]|nr:Tex family protein [Candidatus Enteromonas sp.]
MEISQYLSSSLRLEERYVVAVLKMLEEGSTIPFIARYKKEETGNMSDVTLRSLEEEKSKFEKLEERRKTVLSSIEEQGKLTPELKEEILACSTLSMLETLYRPYKPKRKTRGSIAKEKGLEPLARYIQEQKGSLTELSEKAKSFINPEKGVKTVEEALQGAKDILAEEFSDNPDFYLYAKTYIHKSGKVEAKETKEDVDQKYLNYASFSVPVSKIKPYQTLAISRGKKEKKLTTSFAYDQITIENQMARTVIVRNSPFEAILRETIEDSYKRLLGPSVENEIANDLFEKAEDLSLALFSKNLHQLLLGSPLKGKKILGFDPGYRNGCKLALINESGTVLTSCIIYPTVGREREAELKMIEIYKKFGYDAIALGNGTAGRESEEFLRGFLAKYKLDGVSITIVNESGASVYSASPLAIKEFPNMDIEERSSVSLARRLLDPMAELVKIPPEAIGVGQYQHDMDQTRLKQTLSATTMDTVNEVGVWVNTASASLLKYVSGFNEKTANALVSYRDENGPFKTRKDVMKVKGLGPKAFLDAAGFLRIENENPLEKTAVHPKDYEATEQLLHELGLSLEELGSEKASARLSSNLDIPALAKHLGLGEYTLKDIIEELKKPGRDPREKATSASLDSKVKDIKDLSVGMVLNGTVRNISDFGAFVDIGVHQDGLVHISEIANRFIRHPSEVLAMDQIVRVKVIGVDLNRKRISLSIKQVKEDEKNKQAA